MASKKVSGIFGGKGTPAVGSWDAMHSFSTRASDKFGGKVHAAAGYTGGQVSKALQEFYKTEKLNPCITAIKITVDPKAWTTAWEVTIEESPDGKAYVGLNSWGGASGGYPKKLPPSAHAYSNYKKEIQNVLAKNPKADLRNVLDFYIPGGFRQIFFQYTIPDKFPALPKSPNAKKGTVGVKIGPAGSPTDLPDYNGVLVPTVTLEEEPPTIAASASNPDQAKTDAADAAAQQPPVQEGPLDPRKISGKFVLKVKSGPGVIIGDTEVDITEGVANFTGIQFDQPGDYVISVSSAAPDIDSTATEIKIKVLPPPEAIPQESKGASASESSGTRPIIAQIDPASEELVKQIAYERQGSSNTDAQSVASTIGRTVLVNYNGTQINDRDVQSMTLYHDGIVPKIDITFRDTNGMLAKEPPRDEFEVQDRRPHEDIQRSLPVQRNAGRIRSIQDEVQGIQRNIFPGAQADMQRTGHWIQLEHRRHERRNALEKYRRQAVPIHGRHNKALLHIRRIIHGRLHRLLLLLQLCRCREGDDKRHFQRRRNRHRGIRQPRAGRRQD